LGRVKLIYAYFFSDVTKGNNDDDDDDGDFNAAAFSFATTRQNRWRHRVWTVAAG